MWSVACVLPILSRQILNIDARIRSRADEVPFASKSDGLHPTPKLHHLPELLNLIFSHWRPISSLLK